MRLAYERRGSVRCALCATVNVAAAAPRTPVRRLRLTLAYAGDAQSPWVRACEHVTRVGGGENREENRGGPPRRRSEAARAGRVRWWW